MLLTAAILPPLLMAGRQIYSWAWLLLAAGIAVRAMSRLERTRIDCRAAMMRVQTVPGCPL